jgi:hypothetical protein
LAPYITLDIARRVYSATLRRCLGSCHTVGWRSSATPHCSRCSPPASSSCSHSTAVPHCSSYSPSAPCRCSPYSAAPHCSSFGSPAPTTAVIAPGLPTPQHSPHAAGIAAFPLSMLPALQPAPGAAVVTATLPTVQLPPHAAVMQPLPPCGRHCSVPSVYATSVAAFPSRRCRHSHAADSAASTSCCCRAALPLRCQRCSLLRQTQCLLPAANSAASSSCCCRAVLLSCCKHHSLLLVLLSCSPSSMQPSPSSPGQAPHLLLSDSCVQPESQAGTLPAPY